MDSEQKHLYIIMSQTGTFLSRLLKIVTRKEFNHSSISLYDDLHLLYSFGRRKAYNPFIGGFVAESASFGTFKRFPDTLVEVYAIEIDDKQYEGIEKTIQEMYAVKNIYRYNYVGIAMAGINKVVKIKNRYYCSEYVAMMLKKHNIKGYDALPSIVHPVDFAKLPGAELVYRGKLTDYKAPKLTYA
ncbi:MAG: hypothetical protein ACI4GZ_02290 [Ruminococcus sp.]